MKYFGLEMGVVLGVFTSVSVASQFWAGEHNSLSFAKFVCLWVLTFGSAAHKLKIVLPLFWNYNLLWFKSYIYICMLVCLITFVFHTIFDETHWGGGVKEIFVLQVNNNNSISAKEEKLKTNLGSDV